MRFLPLGGTSVGASCYLYELGTTRLLIDCGIQPGLLGTESLPKLDELAELKPDDSSSPTPTATTWAPYRCFPSIEEHYTDTAGFTEHVFALCHLFGFRFAPRIRDLGEKRLYVPEGGLYPHMNPLMGKPLDIKLIEAHWDDLLRLATSMKLGTVTATLMLSKLRAYPRQNGLALRELGKLERTLFTLRWLQSPELRRRVTVGLNKGKARNALADAAHFNRKGEAREKTLLAQLHKASGLNPLIAAIGVWNTVYLQRAIAQLAADGTEIESELLAHVLPLAWEHIGLTGDYVWRTNKLPKQGEYLELND